MMSTAHYLILGSILFSIGLMGVLTRRNVILVFISLELMLNAVNLFFLSWGLQFASMEAQVAVLFFIALAAVEAGISLSLALMLSNSVDGLNLDRWNQLKG